MNPLFRLLGVGDTFENFDQKVKRVGWVSGCKWLIESLGIGYEHRGGSLPKNGASIIYSNHPSGLDPYLLIAAMDREDSYFWGDFYQAKKGKNIGKHIIGVAPRPFWTIIRRPLTNWPGYIYMRVTTPTKSKEETRKINKMAIEKTVNLLKKGHQVLIFPYGGEYEFLPKKRGLSILQNECKKRNIKINIYEIKIENFGELRLLSHFIFKTKIQTILSYTKIR